MTGSGDKMVYEFHQFQLDAQHRVLLSAAEDRPIALSGRVFDTLLYFVEHRGELLDKSTLMKAIWPNVVVEENNLNQSISALRRVLGESPGEHRFIVTEAGRGYRFVADVRTQAVPAATPPPTESIERATPVSVAAEPSVDAERRSIAVLPFVNVTGDPGKEYFSDGMADELIHTLSRVPGLRVPARTSSFAYKGRNMDVCQIARDLNVGAVLEGSVRSAGERIRVTTQLIDGRSGYNLWSQNYDRQFEDLFKLQEELATAIVQALRAQMHADLPSVVTQVAPTNDLEAYELYLQVESLLRRPSLENLRTAQELVQKATARDPQFARAYAAMGRGKMQSLVLGAVDPDALSEAEQAALRALSLDPDLAYARAVLAQVRAAQGKWLVAAKDFQAALSLNEADAALHILNSTFLISAGHLHEALREVRAAEQLAPGIPLFKVQLGVIFGILGLDTEATSEVERAINLGVAPDSLGPLLVRSKAASQRGDAREAGALMSAVLPAEVRRAGGADAIELIYAASADSSRKAAAASALRKLRASQPGMDSNLMTVLSINWYTRVDALDDAYEVADRALDRMQRSGFGGNWGGLWFLEMRPFRQDSRFQAFAQRLGLMEYWKEYGPPDNCELRDGKLISH